MRTSGTMIRLLKGNWTSPAEAPLQTVAGEAIWKTDRDGAAPASDSAEDADDRIADDLARPSEGEMAADDGAKSDETVAMREAAEPEDAAEADALETGIASILSRIRSGEFDGGDETLPVDTGATYMLLSELDRLWQKPGAYSGP